MRGVIAFHSHHCLTTHITSVQTTVGLLFNDERTGREIGREERRRDDWITTLTMCARSALSPNNSQDHLLTVVL